MPWEKPPLIRPQPPKPPLVAPIPPTLALPANAPTRAIQMLIVDPYYPRDHALRMQAMAAAIASQAGVRLQFPPIAEFLMPAWITFTEEQLPSVRNYAKQHTNHVVLLVKTIFISRPDDTRYVGGLGGARFSIIAAVSCEPSIIHEFLHPALAAARIDPPDGHRNVPGNVMHKTTCGTNYTNIDADQAAALRVWASKKAGAREVEYERVWWC